MANLQRCPKGHFYDVDQYNNCPYCEDTVEPPPPPPAPSRQRMPWIITGVAVLASIFFFFCIGKAVQDKKAVEQELKKAEQKLENYSQLEKIYGHASDSYYSGTPVLVVEAGAQEAAKLPIYWNLSGTIYLKESNSNINAEWSKEWNNHWTHVLITGSAQGYYTIHFTNNVDSTAFDVLIIVK